MPTKMVKNTNYQYPFCGILGRYMGTIITTRSQNGQGWNGSQGS